jgi:beta-fructofuranosidase
VSLRLPDHWLWDFWFAVDGDDVHVFYLQAPRALGDPGARHVNATVGHAVSRDLRRWEILGAALAPGAAGDFDGVATWTGSILRHDGRWLMFYTGLAADGVQRVGLARSDDLLAWEKAGPLLAADPRWYGPVRWRDPWVFAHGGRFHMLVCADRVIGHAWSDDLLAWEAGPPLSEPSRFRPLEVPQLLPAGDGWRIVFCAMEPEPGTYYLAADEPLGRYAPAGILLRDHYAGRVLEHRGERHLFGWHLRDFELSDPLPYSP